MPSVRQEFEERALQASFQKSSYEEYLLDLVHNEHLSRTDSRYTHSSRLVRLQNSLA